MHSHVLPAKTCQQNIVANLNDMRNVKLIVEGERKNSESLGTPGLVECNLRETKCFHSQKPNRNIPIKGE